MLKFSETLKDRLKFEEGLRLTAYRDTVSVKTIGYGHNLDASPYFTVCGGVPSNMRRIPAIISVLDAEAILEEDIYIAWKKFSNCWPTIFAALEHDTARHEAVTMLFFQLGNAAKFFVGLFKALTIGDYNKAALELLNSRYAKQCPARAKRLASQIKTGEYYEILKS
jgi:lysozyme